MPNLAEIARRDGGDVVDDMSYHAAEVDHLEAVVPTLTKIGGETLHASFVNGGLSKDQILARQEAIQEFEENYDFREQLEHGLEKFGDIERSINSFMNNNDSVTAYRGVGKAVKSIQELGRAVALDSATAPDSRFLRDNVLALEQFNGSDIAAFMRGPHYFTARGVKSKDQLHWYDPRLRFRPYLSGRLAALMAADFYATRHGYVPEMVGTMSGFVGMYSVMTLVPNGRYGETIKDVMFNRPTLYNKLRRQIASAPEYEGMRQAIGKLDMMLGLTKLREASHSNGYHTAFPEISQADTYEFNAEELRNPLLAVEASQRVIANTVTFGGDNRLTFLTGPNSGGKSTLAKAVILNQLLGQTGGACVARDASLTVADKIAYHVPVAPDLTNESGRFGFELSRVRQILDEATPASLTILDDCLDGTTHAERVEILKNVMTAFRHLGGATIFSTHAYELVEYFEEQGEGQFWQVGFKDDEPTYQVLPGISKTSHADRVAALHGFTADQVAAEIDAKLGADQVV